MKIIIPVLLIGLCLFSIPSLASWCESNDTIAWNTSSYFNSTWYNITNYQPCYSRGCDNITGSCNPLEYEQTFYQLLFIVIIIGVPSLIIVLLLKRRKR